MQTVRANGEVEGQLHSFLTSALHVDKGLDSSPATLPPLHIEKEASWVPGSIWRRNTCDTAAGSKTTVLRTSSP